MNQLTSEKGKPQSEEGKRAFKRHTPLVSLAIAVGIVATPIISGAQNRGRQEQCSASVQTGTIPSYTTNGSHVTLLSTPLLRENSYLSVSLPESYMTRLRTAAAGRPADQRSGMVADILQNNVQIAYARLGSGSRVTFDCAPLDGSLPVAASATAQPAQSASARPVPSALPALPSATAVPTAIPSATAVPTASAPDQDAGAPRRRTINP